MGAALRLRLLEARRRGGLPLALLLGGAVFAVGAWGGATPDGRYGLATDLAATLGYVAALFAGAFPLALDRERRRGTLPAASPVPPWQWALGNAAAAALAGALFAFVLFACAGLGAAAGGGVETRQVARTGGTGLFELPRGRTRIITVAEGSERLRLVLRAWLTADEIVGTTDALTVHIDGEAVTAYPDRPFTVPIRSTRVPLVNGTPDYAVFVSVADVRALGARRPFLANACGAGVAPALGAGALAALGVGAGAFLAAPVAALLLLVLLAFASLKGFLLESLAAADRAPERPSAHAGHHHGPAATAPAPPHALRARARAVVTALLALVPDLNELDRTGRVALGEWTGLQRSGSAALLGAAALALATLLGGAGLHWRRTP